MTVSKKISGTCDVVATKAGDTKYNGTTSAPVAVALAKVDQESLTVVSSPTTLSLSAN